MLATLIITTVAVAFCVLIHYELLISITARIAGYELKHRGAIVFGALRAMLSHIVHVWLFAGSYKLLLLVDTEHGAVLGTPVNDFFDWVYFSFVVYTTLGFGDMVPSGWLRFMVGTEAITGLVMIAWTASFLFLELQRQWRGK